MHSFQNWSRIAARQCCRKYNSASQPQDVLLKAVGEAPGIMQLTLNRHAGKNAFNKSMVTALQSLVQDLQQDDKIRAVILASSVPGVFCAGADLKERAKFTEAEVVTFVSSLRELMSKISEVAVPVIAAIEGVALGGGLELALAADIRVATAASRLGLPETRLAIIPGAGGTQRLPRLINPAVARELIFTGRILNGTQAHALGLVNHVVESDAVGKAIDIATEIANAGPLGVRAAKRAINRGSDVSLDQALKEEEAAYATVVPTLDRAEGLAAFREKRTPLYRGR